MDLDKNYTDYDLKEFGKRISACRRALDIPQKQLSQMIHVSNNHLSNIENGKSAPSFLTFISICQALQVSPSYLIYGIGFSVDSVIAEKISRKSNADKVIISKILDTFPDGGA